MTTLWPRLLVGAFLGLMLTSCDDMAMSTRASRSPLAATDTLPHATIAEMAARWKPWNSWSWNWSEEVPHAERDPWDPTRLGNVFSMDGGRWHLSVTLLAGQSGGRFDGDQILISDIEANWSARYHAFPAEKSLALNNKCVVSLRGISGDFLITVGDLSDRSATLRLSDLRRARMQHLFRKAKLGNEEFALGVQAYDGGVLFFPIETVIAACDPTSDWRDLVPLYVVPHGVRDVNNKWEYPKTSPIGDSGFIMTRQGIEIIK